MYSCMHFDDILIEKVRSVELHFCTFFLYIHVQQKDKENEDTFIIYQKLAIITVKQFTIRLKYYLYNIYEENTYVTVPQIMPFNLRAKIVLISY